MAVVDCILNIDQYLNSIIQTLGIWSYVIFFLIIFAETGLVVTPFLPGDSFLFALGTFAAVDSLSICWLFLVLAIAAIAGDSVNYSIGRNMGSRILARNKIWFIRKTHIQKTETFFEKHGSKTIVMARFVPIVRTFAPFVAGIGKMNYSQFVIYNIAGGVLWVAVLLLTGFYFGNIRIVKDNFGATLLLIIFISIMPAIIELLKNEFRKRKERRS